MSKSNNPLQRGFTLIELMIVVAIIGILAAVAMPAYSDYVLRGYLVDATSGLSAGRASFEQYYQDNRTYVGATCPSSSTTRWSYVCSGTSAASPSTYIITATGAGAVNGFIYSVNQDNVQTSKLSTAWGGATTTGCWIIKRGGSC